MEQDTRLLVSIAIPVYNREVLIKHAIDSVLAQTEKSFELIVTDNCSTDSTWKIVQEYAKLDSRVRAFQNKENIGPVRNWQMALSQARGRYFKFLWSDDWLAPDFLEKAVKPLNADSRIAFSFAATDIVSDAGTVHSYRVRNENAIIPARDFYYGSTFGGTCPLSPGCALFRREDVQSSLLVDVPNTTGLDFSRFGAGNDLLMMLLPLVKNKKIAYVNDTRAFFYSHSGSLSVANDISIYYDIARVHFAELSMDRLFASRLYLARENTLQPSHEILKRLSVCGSSSYVWLMHAKTNLTGKLRGTLHLLAACCKKLLSIVR